ncbi:hypothetical protein Hanom_Chr08g00734121 [Helianthus anomalus]
MLVRRFTTAPCSANTARGRSYSESFFQIPVTGSWTQPRVAPTRPRGQPSVT